MWRYLPGRDRGQLTDHVVDEVVRDVLGDAQRAEADVRAGVERRRDPVAVQLRVRGERRVGVARHVDLGDDLQIPRGGVPDDLLVLGLGVVAALPAADLRRAAVRGEPRPGVDGDAPALVVAQVQVQLVDLVEGELVDVALDLVDGEEVPGDVEHRAAVGVARGCPRWCRPRRATGRAAGVLLDGGRAAAGAGSARRGRGRPAWAAVMVTPDRAAVEAVALGAQVLCLPSRSRMPPAPCDDA